VARLSDLDEGQSGRIVRVDDQQDEISLRLLEMGLTPGIDVARVGSAPLGDPLEFEVRGYRLSLRRSEAALVEIEPLGP